jgi:hypothetical protein
MRSRVIFTGSMGSTTWVRSIDNGPRFERNVEKPCPCQASYVIEGSRTIAASGENALPLA